MSELTVWCDVKDCKYNFEGRCCEWNVHIGHNKYCETCTLDSNKKNIFEIAFNHITAPLVHTYNAEHNYMVLRSVEEWANDYLFAKGYLFLIEVLNEIGFDVGDLIRNGRLNHGLGWILDKNGKVSFGPLTPGVDMPLKFEVINVYDALRI